jgi:phosphopantothenoylcysteine decarboxylase / phosphopantothenate---cysteine ligase
MFKRVIITSVPTIEQIDPVRFISNRSSGKSGFHLANEAFKRNIPEIIFITGPSCFIPSGVTVVPIETAAQMRNQLLRYREKADVIIMSAAVCDYRPAHFSPRKIKKDRDNLSIELVKTPDILMDLGKQKPPHQILVGYAAETDDVFTYAWKKFEAKNLDMLVLNEVSEENPAFNTDDNQVYLLFKEGMRKLEKMNKETLASQIWDEVFKIKENASGGPIFYKKLGSKIF